MPEGTLVVNQQNQIRVKFINKNGKSVEHPVPEAELSQPLKQEDRRQLNGRKVELDEVNGQPKKVRPVGEQFISPIATVPAPQPTAGRSGVYVASQAKHASVPQSTATTAAFHNPYNFVPTPPRKSDDPDLGDGPPIGQHVLHPDRYTGVIRVRMRAVTPLLLPDAAKATEYDRDDLQQGIQKDHKSFPVRIGLDGKPYIPPTSIKGMLRSAYEAVTNSRLAVFPGTQATSNRNATGHGARLAFPSAARVEGIPARIDQCDENQLVVRVLSKLWLKSAAKLPRYAQRANGDRRKKEGQVALRYHPDKKTLPQLGEHVCVKVQSNGRVVKIVPYDHSLSKELLEGWVLVTEPNINNKKFERVFVVNHNDEKSSTNVAGVD